MKRYTPAEVMEAAQVLFNATRIEKTNDDICIVRKINSQIAERTYLSNVAIDWGDRTSYEPPKPWRPARMPDDWGKAAFFSDSPEAPDHLAEPSGIIVGYDSQLPYGWFRRRRPGYTSDPRLRCWVRDE